MKSMPFTEKITDIFDFNPAIPSDLVRHIEQHESSFAKKQQRRLCLFACSSPVETLNQLSLNEPNSYDEIIKIIEAYQLHLNQLLDLAQCAHARMKHADLRNFPEKGYPSIDHNKSTER